ncbi:glycosyltransferase family 4 protein [Desertihabitans aurantiacus]|uniref:glycosyltransferase family 4 protein n=1 Tax=Desertihabitans aurantiacus TaxID=2282477 RepID=UPI001300B85B|nr:glycosyltransferase family 4 protein [Desertihabitans aurantiacus]
MMQSERFEVAVEALKNALELDPSEVALFELLNELVHRSGESLTSVRRAALDQLVEVLPDRPSRHRDLLPVIIRGQHRLCLDQLGHSTDPVVRFAVVLNDLNHDEWEAALQDTNLDLYMARLAQILCLLGRGGSTQAARLLAALPADRIPVVPVRMTIKALVWSGRGAKTRGLLQEYLRARPEDRWAQRLQAEYGRVGRASAAERASTERRLAEQGFPFPAPAEGRAYDPLPDRVLYSVYNSLPFHSAGYATRTHGLLTALNRDGWRVDAVSRIGYPFDLRPFADHGPVQAVDQIGDVTYRRLTTERTVERRHPLDAFIGRYATALRAQAEAERPFLLHAASNHLNGLAVVTTARQLGLPSVYELRGLWEVTRASRDQEWATGEEYRYLARMELDAAHHATRVITITEALKAEMVRRGVDGDKIGVVPNGVDTERFLPRARDRALAEQLGVADKVVIGYVGSLVDYEGLELLVEAAGVLSGVRRDFAVLVVGDGVERERLQTLTANAGLGDVVRFLGRVAHEEVERYYSIMDICPLPRLPLPVTEMVSPLKPFEAMAMAKVVVASDVAALAEVVEDGVNGMLHKKGDAGSLAAVLRVLLDDAELRARVSSQARAWVVQHRRWEVLARRMTALYEEIGGVRQAPVG